uniref:BTB domain-containing protein n=1 Tax=Cuerna arida TaxID=1464854 RepID=A0A1B6FAI1_9HEMI
MELVKWNIFSLLEATFMARVKTVCVYGSLGNEALLITRDDEVYAIGPNTAGCLGLGNLQSTLTPKKVEVLCGKNVVGFGYGSGPHVVAFTESGEIYTWGHNGYCELGNGTTNQILTPTLVNTNLLGKAIIEVACGSHHSLALSSDGEVYAWGWNNCGQVGSALNTNQSVPKKVLSPTGGKKAISIACGQTSSMAVIDDGEVYAWGYNGSGQLGIGHNINQQVPTKVMGLANVVIVKVVCGYAHTLALSDEGTLYAWGANTHGQLATGNKSNLCTPFPIIADIGRIVEIAATHYGHISAAMTQNCTVYMWGQCRGQTVCEPTATPFTSLHEVFACCANPSVMWQPVNVRCEQGRSITDSIKMAFDDEKTSDLTIMVENKPIYVHKAILKIRCEHFTSMFQDHWDANNQKVVEMNHYSYPVYRAFLQYLYTDQVDLPPETALKLLDLANSYCEFHLKQRCEQIITQGITVQNAAMLYSTAITYQSKGLEEFCFKFSLNHMTAVILSSGYSELDDVIAKNFIREAAKSGAFKS